MLAVIKRPSVISTELKPALPARRSLSEGGSEVEGWRNLIKAVLAHIRPAESKAEGIDSSTPLRCARNDKREVRCARNDEREVRCARNDESGPEALIMTSIALSTKQFFGLVQEAQILCNIDLWLHSVWQPQIRRIWGWLHHVWSFAIPKLRLRLPPRIEQCQFFRKFILGNAAGFLVISGTAAKAEFVFGTPKPVPNVNTIEYGECGSSISADGLELYFRGSDSFKRTPRGYGNWDLYVAKRDSIFLPWNKPVNLGKIVNDPTVTGSHHIEGPSISGDGLELYFSSSRPGAIGWTGKDSDYDIWVTTRATKDSPWQTPVNLGPVVNSSSWELYPSISGDGRELYFYSKRLGGVNPQDIWVTTRATKNDSWSEPVNLGPVVNSKGTDFHPCISNDGLALYFVCVNKPGGYGYHDIWVSTRDSTNDSWEEPVNLGPSVNTPLPESGPNISSDGLTLYFDVLGISTTQSWYAGSDIYQVSITPVVDLNADKKIDLKDFAEFALKWGQEGSVDDVDIAPSPFGDGKIDVKDLAVFSRFYLQEDGLMALWKLDEPIKIRDYNIAHERISGYDGTFHGNPISVEGKVNGAVQFDGIDDCIETPFVWDPAYGAFSAFAWVKGGNPGEVIISQKGTSFDKGIWLGLSLEGKVMTELTSGSRGSGELVSESTINNNDWHHVGVVWDGARRHLYIDGEESAKDNGNIGQLRHLNGGLYFGAGKFLEPGSFWSGSIDEIKIYNKALSIEEIAALSRKQGAEPPVFSGENFETGDFSKFDWKFDGDADWIVSTLKKNSGNYSARAGFIYDDEKAGLELTLNCSSGDISFYRNVSSESGCDCLEFYIDGIKQDEWSGEKDWEKESFSVASGTRTFKWVYSKDGSVSEGYDSAWIDDIVFPVSP